MAPGLNQMYMKNLCQKNIHIVIPIPIFEGVLLPMWHLHLGV